MAERILSQRQEDVRTERLREVWIGLDSLLGLIERSGEDRLNVCELATPFVRELGNLVADFEEWRGR